MRPIDLALVNVAAVVSAGQTELSVKTAPRPSVRMYEVHSSVSLS